ncbi:MAG: hypothetical protein MRJ93_11600 [Nitrososphaeraceae archaeon]|nr:hypothetical protein [Nitrososphaeraceae archaeon]
MNNTIFKSKEIKQYMLYLVDYKKVLIDEDVEPEVESVLLRIAYNSASSISKYHQYINDEYNQKEDKALKLDNVKTIVKLDELGLIRKVTENNEDVQYSITSLGLFYIFKKDLVSSIKDILLKNRNDTFFQTFLYPYIELNTLEKLNSREIFLALSKYLVTCARIVNNVVIDHLLKVENNKGDRIMVGFPKSSVIPEAEDPFDYGPYDSISYLKNRYNISWLDEENLKIRDEITEENKKIIRVYNEKERQELVLKINLETNRTILVDNSNNNEIAKFDLEKHPFEKNSYIMWDLIPCTPNQYLDHLFENPLFYFYDDMKNNLNNLCFSILQNISYDVYLPTDEFNERLQDCDTIVNDKIFRKLADNLRGEFDSYFYHELELKPLPVHG